MADLNYRELFASRLRALRIAADLTIEQASERGGLSPNFWGTVERNEQEPCLDSIFGFAKGIGISVVTLLTFEKEAGKSQDRQELNDLLDLFTPNQLRLALGMSRLIHGYRPEIRS
jgi:transcriptional regulator with XRE-family HTH domain